MTAAFFALWLWARKSPLPAAIVGLTAYLSLMAASVLVAGPGSLAQGVIVKVIIVLALLKAIGAGVQHRRLLITAEGR